MANLKSILGSWVTYLAIALFLFLLWYVLAIERRPIFASMAFGMAIVVLIVAIYILIRKRKKPELPALRISANPNEILADGKSTSNLTIELLDKAGNPVSTEEDTEVSLSASGGSIAEKVTIPKGKTSASAVLTSSMKIGTAVISASSVRLKSGSAEVTFKEKKRYCMHCGEKIPLDAKSCPRCGKAPPSGVDTKVCKNCNAVIPTVAKYCGECGAGQPS